MFTLTRSPVLNLVSGPFPETLQGSYTLLGDANNRGVLRSVTAFAQPLRLDPPPLFSPVEPPQVYDPTLQFSSPGDKNLW